MRRVRSTVFVLSFLLPGMLVAGCHQGTNPVGPSFQTADARAGTQGEVRAETVSSDISITSAPAPAVGTGLTLQTLTFPKPTLTYVPGSAAPGATLTIKGTNFYPQGAFVRPNVWFGSTNRTATVVNNNQISVSVPSGAGSVSLYVDAVGGKTQSVVFRYQTPSLSGLSPSSGPPDQVVTLYGSGFGGNTNGSSVKFGSSLATVVDWSDTRIVVRAPADFGTGTNTMILVSSLGCLAAQTPARWLAKVISMPGCGSLVNSLYTRLQLATNGNSIQKSVPVVVRTSAGTSTSQTYLYHVTIIKN